MGFDLIWDARGEYELDKNLEGGRSIFMDMADYLERNPNMFLNFDC